MPTVIDSAKMISLAYDAKINADGTSALGSGKIPPAGWVLEKVIDNTNKGGGLRSCFCECRYA